MLEALCCIVFFCIPLWVLFGLIGAVVGSSKEAGAAGFGLGLLLGPIGCIIAAFIDGRPRCPICRERVSTGTQLCPHCQHNFRAARQQAIEELEEEYEEIEQAREERRAVAAERKSERRQALVSKLRSAAGWVLARAKLTSLAVDRLLMKLAGDDEFMLWFFRVVVLVIVVVAITVLAFAVFQMIRSIADKL